jgi:DNA-directed RNA polymerase specialized sigma24 family protein
MEALSDVRATGAQRSASGHTDADVIARSRREPEGFAEIFDRHYAEIHGFLARRLGASLADDLASETFLIAFDRRRRYDTRHESARPWLFGIAAKLVARRRGPSCAATAHSPAWARHAPTTPSRTTSRDGSTRRRSGDGSPRRWRRSRTATARCSCSSHGRT